jgi:hypothetical protein
MSEDVFQNEPGHDEDPVLNPTAPVQTTNLPGAMQRGKGDGSEYTKVKTGWESADFGVTQMLADVWGQGMGWEGGGGLVGKKPVALLKEFETLYLSCPWVMASS